MRKLWLPFVLLLFSISLFGQDVTQCKDALNKDLKDSQYIQNQREKKEFLLEYFRSDSEKRRSKKTSATWDSSFKVVVDALPIEGNGDATYKKSKDTFDRIEKESLKEGYVSDDQFYELATSALSDNQLKAYIKCLDTIKDIIGGTNQNGVFYYTGGDLNDVFWIQVVFKNEVDKKSIKLSEDLLFTNIEPIYGLRFRKEMELLKDKPTTQYFKRIDPEKDASIAFNFEEGISTVRPIEIKVAPRYKNETPVGTIIASVLDYKTFLEANNMKLETDSAKIFWVPCDGRIIKKSKYPLAKVPDLRGLFLRGVNVYGVENGDTPPLDENLKNPENKRAGEPQTDAFQGHKHQLDGNFNTSDEQNNPPNTISADRTGGIDVNSRLRSQGYIGNPIIADTNSGEPRTSSETRPKNVTVYYYVKIN